MVLEEAGEAIAASQNTLLHINGLNKTESPIFILLHVLCFHRQPFRFLFYFNAADVKCRVAAVKRLPVLHHSADYILISFG